MPRGGFQPGAGRPPGRRNNATIEKDLVRELVRQEITKHWQALVHAQIAQATGVCFMVMRGEDGRFERIPDNLTPEGFDALLASDNAFEIWTKDPSTGAYIDLMNRAIDKPREQPQELTLGVSEMTLAILDKWKVKNRERELATDAEDERVRASCRGVSLPD